MNSKRFVLYVSGERRVKNDFSFFTRRFLGMRLIRHRISDRLFGTQNAETGALHKHNRDFSRERTSLTFTFFSTYVIVYENKTRFFC